MNFKDMPDYRYWHLSEAVYATRPLPKHVMLCHGNDALCNAAALWPEQSYMGRKLTEGEARAIWRAYIENYCKPLTYVETTDVIESHRFANALRTA
jgi:hypothetical protein